MYEAENIVASKLELDKKSCSIVPDATREFEKCFAVFYQAKRYIENGDFASILVGHGPVLVDKESGNIFETGSAYPVERYVEAYEVSGDPYTELSHSILISGWNEGANAVDAMKYIRRKLNIGLAESKRYIDSVMGGKAVEINCKDNSTALDICDYLNKHEFIAKQLWK